MPFNSVVVGICLFVHNAFSKLIIGFKRIGYLYLLKHHCLCALIIFHSGSSSIVQLQATFSELKRVGEAHLHSWSFALTIQSWRFDFLNVFFYSFLIYCFWRTLETCRHNSANNICRGLDLTHLPIRLGERSAEDWGNAWQSWII